MRRTAAAVALTALALAVAAHARQAKGQNYAFLVACGQYDVKELRPLKYTKNDITAFAEVLKAGGFPAENVVVLHDDMKGRYYPEANKIRKELELLLAGLDKQDTVVVAFSGHGVQFAGDPQNYFCPLDAQLDDKKTLVSLKEVYDQLEGCRAVRKLLLVDACRNDPLSAIKKSRSTVDLKSVSRPQGEPVPKGIVALFSCSEGRKSYEWPELGHGIFFHHVIQGWKGAANPDGPVTLDQLRGYVKRETNKFAVRHLRDNQIPAERGSFEGEWVLNAPRTAPARAATAPAKGGGQPTAVTPRDEPDLKVDLGGGVAMEFVRIPAGEFLMGAPDGEKDAWPDEQPQHRVRISKDFYLGKYEVTQRQYQALVGENPSNFKNVAGEDTAHFPVEKVSWEDAMRFCAALHRKSVKTVGLPTEAEWEYACRAGTTTAFHFGDVLDGTQANCDGNHPSGTTAAGPSLQRPRKVGSYRPNAFGLYDMHGNVSEWCADWHGEKYHNESVRTDPKGVLIGIARVFRGGSWHSHCGSARAAYRNSGDPSARGGYDYVGFRVALRLD